MRLEQLAEPILTLRVLGEHSAAGDLRDVRGLQMDLKREAIHQAGQFDAPVVEAANQFGEFLLRGDDEPHLAAPDASQALDQRLEIEHLLDVPCHELTDFVHHEDQCAIRATATHQLLAAFS